jgi:asparagine synthase (glutamine-hydrolysing)
MVCAIRSSSGGSRQAAAPTGDASKEESVFSPMEFFFEHPQIRRLIAETLNEDQVRRRGYFEPAYIKNLLGMMETREFVYLKQVMALVILELWHKIFIDSERIW